MDIGYHDEITTEFCNKIYDFLRTRSIGRLRGEKLRCVQRIMDSADYLGRLMVEE